MRCFLRLRIATQGESDCNDVNAPSSRDAKLASTLPSYSRDMLQVSFPEQVSAHITLATCNVHTSCTYTDFLLPFASQALDGFLLVISREGKLLYVSESIAQYLGLKQVRISVHVP